MTFKELRESSGLNMLQFSKYFEIPYRTVQDWEYGKSRCPKYLLNLMQYKLQKESRNSIMTVAEVKEMFKGEYVDIEFYEPRSWGKHAPHRFHTDNCVSVDSASDIRDVHLWELMSEEDYDNSILANSSERADFDMWYDDKNAKVLCIMLCPLNEE